MLALLLEVKLKHNTLKHAQSLGVVERAHGALKRILKLNSSDQWSDWHRYVDLACFIHNTSYYSTIGCTPSHLFHGREPVKRLDFRFKNKQLSRMEPNFDFVENQQDALNEKYAENKENLIKKFHKYRNYFDRKTNASPLKKHSYCLLLNPKLTLQNDFAAKSLQIWLPLYRVEKVYTTSNYLIRKTGTNYTQVVHRMMLRPYEPQESVEDISPIDKKQCIPDPSLGKHWGEPELFDSQLQYVDDLQETLVPNTNTDEQTTAPDTGNVDVSWQSAYPLCARCSRASSSRSCGTSITS